MFNSLCLKYVPFQVAVFLFLPVVQDLYGLLQVSNSLLALSFFSHESAQFIRQIFLTIFHILSTLWSEKNT